MMINPLARSIALFTFMLISACAQQSPETAAAPSSGAVGPALNAYDLYVDAEGNISLPTDFLSTWSHLGAWALVEDGDVAGMHNVYAQARDIDYFRTHGEFADGAMLIKEVRSATGAAHTTGDAHWVEDVQVWFVMVKDTKGRFPDNPLWGEGWGWALFNGDAPDVQVATDYKTDCRTCHEPAQKTDWIYTYAYPALGEKALASAPVKTAALAPAAMSSMTDAQASDNAREETGVTGEAAFVACKACHSAEPGQHGVGPSLAGVVGRKAGAAEGFAYSPEMKSADIVWTADTLDAHIADPASLIPGNRMALMFPAGVESAETRAAIIDYLETLPAQ